VKQQTPGDVKQSSANARPAALTALAVPDCAGNHRQQNACPQQNGFANIPALNQTQQKEKIYGPHLQ
jgi:hypothetical protein